MKLCAAYRRYECEALTSLLLQQNCFAKLPADIGSLDTLKVLNVACNELTSLPDEIADLATLVHLDVSSNQCASRPCSHAHSLGRTSMRVRVVGVSPRWATCLHNLAAKLTAGAVSSQLAHRQR